MQSALFLGRFQPFHNGHLSVIKRILKENERVIIAIGSAEQNYVPQNPFTASERYQMIEESLKEAKISADKYCIIPVRNIFNYSIWVNHVNTYVPPYTRIYTGSKLIRACYEGKYFRHGEKDKKGPEIVQLKRLLPISATKVRNAILKNRKWENLVPKAVATKIKEWEAVNRIKTIRDTIDTTKFNSAY
jgi:nicotinamide-nucleotide adenylyltransferase